MGNNISTIVKTSISTTIVISISVVLGIIGYVTMLQITIIRRNNAFKMSEGALPRTPMNPFFSHLINKQKARKSKNLSPQDIDHFMFDDMDQCIIDEKEIKAEAWGKKKDSNLGKEFSPLALFTHKRKKGNSCRCCCNKKKIPERVRKLTQQIDTNISNESFGIVVIGNSRPLPNPNIARKYTTVFSYSNLASYAFKQKQIMRQTPHLLDQQEKPPSEIIGYREAVLKMIYDFCFLVEDQYKEWQQEPAENPFIYEDIDDTYTILQKTVLKPEFQRNMIEVRQARSNSPTLQHLSSILKQSSTTNINSNNSGQNFFPIAFVGSPALQKKTGKEKEPSNSTQNSDETEDNIASNDNKYKPENFIVITSKQDIYDSQHLLLTIFNDSNKYPTIITQQLRFVYKFFIVTKYYGKLPQEKRQVDAMKFGINISRIDLLLRNTQNDAYRVGPTDLTVAREIISYSVSVLF